MSQHKLAVYEVQPKLKYLAQIPIFLSLIVLLQQVTGPQVGVCF